MLVTIAAEGVSDAAVLRRICRAAALEVGSEYVTDGKSRLDEKLRAYNHAARFGAWLVARDLDHDADCAPELLRRLLPEPASGMALRIPVRAAEAWLLADRAGFATYFGVSQAVVPPDPETLDRPKRTVVDLAKRSTKRAIRDAVVPAPGHTVEVGREYTATIIEFASTVWNPERAADRSASLRRCLAAVSRFSR